MPIPFRLCPWVAMVARASGTKGDSVVPLTPTLAPQTDADIAQQFPSLKAFLALRIMLQRGGILRVAGKLDVSPSHLSEQLSGGGARGRKFDIDTLEHYIATFNDLGPIHYLIAKYMPENASKASALHTLALLAEQIPGLLAAASDQTKGAGQ